MFGLNLFVRIKWNNACKALSSVHLFPPPLPPSGLSWITSQTCFILVRLRITYFWCVFHIYICICICIKISYLTPLLKKQEAEFKWLGICRANTHHFSIGEGQDKPLQSSCCRNPRDSVQRWCLLQPWCLSFCLSFFLKIKFQQMLSACWVCGHVEKLKKKSPLWKKS